MQVVDHTASRGKGFEIPDALVLLDKLNLADTVVTADAMLTQKEVVRTICKKKGDYVLPVKDNQETLKESIETAFNMPAFSPENS